MSARSSYYVPCTHIPPFDTGRKAGRDTETPPVSSGPAVPDMSFARGLGLGGGHLVVSPSCFCE